MLPEAGWLPFEWFEDPVDALLPQPYKIELTNPVSAALSTQVAIPFPVFDDLFVMSYIDRKVGFDQDLVRTMVLEFVQINVFGVLMLDAFDPPAISIELFDFAYLPTVACVTNPQTGNPTDFATEVASGESTVGSCEIGGATEWVS